MTVACIFVLVTHADICINTTNTTPTVHNKIKIKSDKIRCEIAVFHYSFWKRQKARALIVKKDSTAGTNDPPELVHVLPLILCWCTGY